MPFSSLSLHFTEKEKDPALQIPNSWPDKEKILRAVQQEREDAVERRKKIREASKKKREWEKANPEAVRIRAARAQARAMANQEQAKISNKLNQQYSNQLLKVLPRCNVIIQVLDARAPLSSISDSVETMIEAHQHQMESVSGCTEKTIVYVLNKIDLVNRKHVEQWAAHLAKNVLLDDESLKLKRRVAAYSAEYVDSPLCLMRALQTVYLRGSTKHKVVAAVTGFSSVGKNSLLRDMEAASQIVSVHTSAEVPNDVRTKIAAAREVALVTLPPDSDLMSTPAKTLNCIYKQPALIESGGVLSAEGLVELADSLVSLDAVRVATHFKVSKPASGTALLEALAKKRGIMAESGKGLDIVASGKIVAADVVSGKLLVAAKVAAAEKSYGNAAPKCAPLDPVFDTLLKQCQVQKAKSLEVDGSHFITKDHKIMVEIDEEDDVDEKGDKYELNSEDWSGEEEEMEEGEEMEVDEEGEEMEVDEEGEEDEEEE